MRLMLKLLFFTFVGDLVGKFRCLEIKVWA